jgi:hypothetical protein
VSAVVDGDGSMAMTCKVIVQSASHEAIQSLLRPLTSRRSTRSPSHDPLPVLPQKQLLGAVDRQSWAVPAMHGLLFWKFE